MHPDANEPPVLAALASLNQIGAAVNQLGPEDQAAVTAVLHLVVESVSQMLLGAAAAIYTYDAARAALDAQPCVMAGAWGGAELADQARLADLRQRAVLERRVVLAAAEDLAGDPGQGDADAALAACYPLVASDRPLGVLCVEGCADRRLSPLALLLLDNCANLAAAALRQGQTQQPTPPERDLARAEDELERLRRADMLISSRLNLKETLEAILHMALEVTGARYGIFRLVDKTGRKLVSAAVAGEGLRQPAVEALPINATSIMGWVAKHRQPLRITDLRANPWARIYYPLDHDLDMRSELVVPLIGASGRLEGVLNLESTAVGAFSEQDSHLLQALATQAVIAIQEVRLLDALQEIAERLLSQPPQAVFDRLVDLACDLLNTPVGHIWVLDAAAEQLVLQAANVGYRRGERIPLHGSLTGEAILRCQAVAVDDVRADPRFQRRALAVAEGWAGALVMPLLAGPAATPLGAFLVISHEADGRRFAESEWDKKVLNCLAHHAALAVQEAQRREALRAAEEQRALAETFAAMGDIAANLLHRVNNKVGIIPVRVEGIQDKCAAAVQADPYLAANLAEIERSANEAMAVMRESLFHLRPITMTTVSVASSVAEAVATSGLPPTVQVRTEGLAELPLVKAGAQRLVLVFSNLLENAAAAMEGHGVITIRGVARGDYVEVAVADTGPGIPPDLHEHIFEFDFSGRKVHAGKLGFGLWWVRTLMARFGGSVAVESDGRHGATFILRLPRAT